MNERSAANMEERKHTKKKEREVKARGTTSQKAHTLLVRVVGPITADGNHCSDALCKLDSQITAEEYS